MYDLSHINTYFTGCCMKSHTVLCKFNVAWPTYIQIHVEETCYHALICRHNHSEAAVCTNHNANMRSYKVYKVNQFWTTYSGGNIFLSSFFNLSCEIKVKDNNFVSETVVLKINAKKCLVIIKVGVCERWISEILATAVSFIFLPWHILKYTYNTLMNM